LAINLIYTTSTFPPKLEDNIEIKSHEESVANGEVGLVSSNGTVCRIVDFMPGNECIMHVSKGLDYGIVVEGETKVMKRGELPFSGQLCMDGRTGVIRNGHECFSSWRIVPRLEEARSQGLTGDTCICSRQVA
jgi:hypothetical protein